MNNHYEGQKSMITLGVIADTHIPDRAQGLQPQIMPIFEEAAVQAILHAGDISSPSVIEELRQLAPVYAVRGNRDLFRLRGLPHTRSLNFGGVPIILTHGHGGWREFLIDKGQFMREGYRLERYQSRLLTAFPQAHVIIFGHTHVASNVWVNGHLLLNPGSPHFPLYTSAAPSIALLHIESGGRVKGEVIYLE
jgi:putative phosphoesterase